MTSKDCWVIVRFIVLSVAITVGVVHSTWAAPGLRRSVEYSNATSQSECGKQAASVLERLQKEGRFSEHEKSWARTKDSTVSIECILVGRSEQRAKQWIFYVVVATNDRPEGPALMELLRKRLHAIERID